MYDKHIAYDRETRDYSMHLDGLLIGFARTYHEAEVTLDQTVFELMNDGHFSTATELDGGSDPLPDPGPGGPGVPGDERPWQSGLVVVQIAPEYMLMPEGDVLDADGMRVSLLDDVARVIDMALGNEPAKDVIPELRRVRARLAAVQADLGLSANDIAAHLASVYAPNWQPAVIAADDLPY